MTSDSKTKITSRFRLATGTALMLVLFYALYSWALAPHVTYVRAMQRYEPVAVTLRQGAEALQSTLDEDEETLRELQAQLTEVGHVLFTQADIQGFLRDLEVLAAERACHLTEVAMEPRESAVATSEAKESSVPIDEIEVELKLTGEALDLIATIHDLQVYTRKLFIRSVQLEPIGHDRSGVQGRIGLTLYAVHEMVIAP